MPDLQAALVESNLRRAVDLQRVDADVRRRILAVLRRVERDIVGQLAAVDLTSDSLTAWRSARLQELLAQTRETIRSAYRSARDLHAADMVELAEIEAEFAVRQLRSAATVVAHETTFVPLQMLAEIAADTLIDGAPSSEWWAQQAGNLSEKFAREVRVGLVSGETNDQLVRRIRGRFAGQQTITDALGNTLRVPKYTGGVMDVTTRDAEALVRSSVQAVAHEARRATYRQNGRLVRGVVQLSTLDGRTTDICIAYSGKAWEYAEDGGLRPIGHDLPYLTGVPRHWNCRSTEVPLLRSLEELGLPVGEIPEGTRASFRGQVPVDTTMHEFLESLPRSKVDEMLGAGRAQLWRDGVISLGDLVDQSGRPLSLSRLREKTSKALRSAAESLPEGIEPGGFTDWLRTSREAVEEWDGDPGVRKWLGSLNAEELEALNSWGGVSVHKRINRAKRLLEDIPEDLRDIDRTIESALRRFELDRDAVVWRGLRGEPEKLAALAVGDTIEDLGYMSTSASRSMAMQFFQAESIAEGRSTVAALFEVRLRTGQRGLGWIDPVSHNPGEQEVLLAPGSRWRIVDIVEDTTPVGGSFLRYILEAD